MKKGNKQYDVIVVGAGPAGCIASAILAGRGARVLIVERKKFPREKVCGDYLTPHALDILESLNIYDHVMKRPHNKIDGALFIFPDGEQRKIDYKSNDKGSGHGVVMRRMEFDEALLNFAEESGAIFMGGFEANGFMFEKETVGGINGICDMNNISFTSDIVVLADGVNSKLVKDALGLEKRTEKTGVGMRSYVDGMVNIEPNVVYFIYDERLDPTCYGWIFPLSEKSANVGVSITLESLKKSKISLKKLFLKIIETNSVFKEKLPDSYELLCCKSALLKTGPPEYKLHAPGLLVCGDAAACINPLTGEGISYAMETGRIAGEVALKALELGDFSESVLSEYTVEGMAGISVQFRQARALYKRILEEPNYIKEIYKSNDDPDSESINDFMEQDIEFFTKFIGRNERVFTEIESTVARWPASIVKLWRYLKGYLDSVSSTGDYKDFFNYPVHSFPALPLHWWLESGLDLKKRRSDVTEIAKSTLFYYFYLRIQDNVIDEPESFNSEFLIFGNECIREVFSIYHKLFPPKSELWLYFNQIWTEYSDIAMWDLEKIWSGAGETTEEDMLLLGRKFLPAAIPCVALAFLGRTEEIADSLVTMIENLGVGTQLLNDFLGMEKDLIHGKSTFLISGLLGGSDEGLNPEEVKERVYHNFYATPFIRDYFSIMIEYFNKSREVLSDSRFSDFHRYIDFKIADIGELSTNIVKDIIKRKLNL